MKYLNQTILLFFLLTLTHTTHPESRAEFMADVVIEINHAIDKNDVLDKVIAILLQDYIISRIFHEGIAREAAGLVDENGQALSDEEMNFRIGYLEAKRRVLRAQLHRPPKTLNQFLGQSGPLLAAIPADRIDGWKELALLLAPGIPEA